ncbi:DUF368 domain-containing protein [Paenibacillus thiaminolyticus]|uniref:DUF368 domain-containing protein n=1 Tax=Paenibacillus thiaminolyticus TaxID=49283 RepID=A0AAP9J139_PANTH|nr:DUF368 domain-containing protein [Paenibacillus thiaminolyticus]MCY9538781.1 DUF368 domain-containing protein [Paenibacillus thiaminolyticus]MCY9605479.1 DUF368 domain-containing protein [Paenibacillus thiaminolyticus]MCY9611032.1 DUF368 domain-containing protein [Paenibacillus thiaminolyticus]MCY9616113.1 DUF368 domain-containing protein [Paenibacillus thiaminolyticus]MCY9621638.1 DUF368 domain-containing protein [Paenibacillus thiaminolyticus]
MFEWKNIFRGILIGASDLIPGVSGGTIAIVLGMYERLIAAISGFFSREWKKHVGFLIPLGIGVGGSLLLLSRLMKWLLAEHPQPTFFFFMGLIVGILPFLWKEADASRSFNAVHYLLAIAAGAAVAATAFLRPDGQAPVIELTASSGVFLFMAGWLGSMAMILPGISGSFVLLLLGAYPTAIHALSTLDIPLIAIIGSGVIVGFIVSSKFIRMLLARFPAVMYALVLGMVVGSLVVVYPGLNGSAMTLIISIVTLAAGFAAAFLLGQRPTQKIEPKLTVQ